MDIKTIRNKQIRDALSIAAKKKPEVGSDEYWAEKEAIYARPFSQRGGPDDPTRYISPEEYQKGYLGRKEYALSHGGRASMALGGDPALNVNPVLSQPVQDPTQDYVKYLYQNVLGREAEQGGLDYWTQQLNEGNADQSNVLAAFAASPEFSTLYLNDPSKAISTLYQTALARAPEQSGLDYWTQQAKGGMDLGQLVSGFTSSEEGQNVQAIRNMYQGFGGNFATPEQIQQASQLIGPNQDWNSFIQQTFPYQEVDPSTINPLDYQIIEALNRKTNTMTDATPDASTDTYQNILSNLAGNAYGSYFNLSPERQKYIAGLIGQESGGTPNPLTAGAATSSARGMFQFTDRTWRDQFKKAFGDQTGLSDKQIQALRYDTSPEAQAINFQLGINYMNQGADRLEKSGIPVTPASLYSTHFLGNPGIAKLAMTNPNAPAARAMDAKAIRANKEIAHMTAGQAMKFFESMLENKAPLGYNKVINPYIQLVQDRIPNVTQQANFNPQAGSGSFDPFAAAGAGGNVAGSGMFNPSGAPIGMPNTGMSIDPNAGGGFAANPPLTNYNPLFNAGMNANAGATGAAASYFNPYTSQQGSMNFDPNTGIGIQSPLYMGPGLYGPPIGYNPGAVTGYNPQPVTGLSFGNPMGWKNGGAVKEALRIARATGGGAWTRKEGKNPEGGLNEKGRASLRAQGHDIKRPQPEGGSRKDSFCARMKGMKAKLTSAETANDPNSRINKSLRKWNCADGGAIDDALRLARQIGGGVPDETGQEEFLRKELEGSAPQYDPEGGIRTAKKLALDAYGMTDVGGLQEALGYMPKPEGGYEKSALQHAKEGDYATAGLLAMGAIVPGAGKIGKLAKGAEKVTDPVKDALRTAYERKVSPLGLYSHAAETAANIPQAKGSYEQMMAMLQKAGVKPEEMHWSGVQQFAGQPVTREQLVQHFEQNVPKIEETVLQNRPATPINRSDALSQLESEFADVGVSGTPKFQQYTIPGGENYREVLLGLDTPRVWQNGSPVTAEDLATPMGRESVERSAAFVNTPYQSSHWDQPNVLGHLRMSDRTGPEGEKILHLEELQSDWGQAGRKKGFRQNITPEIQSKVDEIASKLDPRFVPSYMKTRSGGIDTDNFLHRDINHWANEGIISPEEANILSKYADMKSGTGIPSAPYVASPEGKHTSSWVDLGLKRALKEAAEGGYNKLVWTPGAEQAKRYNLSKQIRSMEWNPFTTDEGEKGFKRVSLYPHYGNPIEFMINKAGVAGSHRPGQVLGNELEGKHLSDIVGKDLSEKILGDTHGELFGTDLSVGGEGMKGFYDKILPTQLQKLLKRIDPEAKVQMGGHAISKDGEQIGAHSITITPKMREAILKGLPAYAKGGAIWDKPRPKSLGKPEKLTSKEKSSAKRMAKAAGRPWPNLVDNMRAAREDGGRLSPLMEEKIRDIGDYELAKYGMGPDAPASTRDELRAGPEQTTWERVAEKAMGDRPSPERRRFVEGLGTAADIAHMGAYATPLAPYVGAADFARGVASGDPVEIALGAAGLPGKTAKAVGMAASAMTPESAEAGPLIKALNVIRAYHGSPHKFDKFDISKIGTGEGAQAYGHGLYFAGNEGVARSYRDALANNLESPEAAAKSYLSSYGSVNDAIKAMQDHARGGMGWSTDDMNNLRSGLSLLKSGANLSDVKAPGHMYEVDIHANPEHMLDWDKPLLQQSRHVIDRFNDAVSPVRDADDAMIRELFGDKSAHTSLNLFDKSKGSQAYNTFAVERGGPSAVSERLRKAGIPGIRYLDAGSRLAGDGSSNYVVFDPDIIEILRRYAQGGAVDNALRIAKKS